MHRTAQDLMSENGDFTFASKRLLAEWPQMAGNGERAWLRHLLGQETVEETHLEMDISSATEGQDLHWAV